MLNVERNLKPKGSEKRVVTFSIHSEQPNKKRRIFRISNSPHLRNTPLRHRQKFAHYKEDLKKYLGFSAEVDPDEKQLLGECSIENTEMVPCIPPRDYRQFSNNGEKEREKQKILDELYEFVKRHQPVLPEDKPEKGRIMDIIVRRVKDQIEKESESDIKKINWYTALNTPLDYQHGIDGWIEIKEKGEEVFRLPFDAKTGHQKPAQVNPHGVVTFHIDVDNFYNEDGNFSDKTIASTLDFFKKIINEYREQKRLRSL